jgi:hypothetical protein
MSRECAPGALTAATRNVGGKGGMAIRWACGLIGGLVAGLAPIQGGVAQAYAGLGVSRLSVTSRYSAVDRRDGTGFTLVGGYKLAPTWFAELSASVAHMDVGPTENISYPEDRAEFGSRSETRTTKGRSAVERTSWQRPSSTLSAEALQRFPPSGRAAPSAGSRRGVA